MHDVDLSTIQAFTQLAAQYGPFLFAMLFVLVVTRTAHKYYRESNTRQPAASDEEKRTYRSYFTTSVWVGISLTLLSIGWWVYAQMHGPMNYQVSIVGLQANETVSSDYYTHIVPDPLIPGTIPLHKANFMVAKDVPLKIGDKFEFFYYKDQGSGTSATSTVGLGAGVPATRLEVTYSGNPVDTYQIAVDGGTVKLTVASAVASTNVASSHSGSDIGARRLVTAAASPVKGDRQ